MVRLSSFSCRMVAEGEEKVDDQQEDEFGCGGAHFGVADDEACGVDCSGCPQSSASFDGSILLRLNDSGDGREFENSRNMESSVPSTNNPRPMNDEFAAEDYDPKRIPASVFVSKPTNQTDWSVASNESLFSIQIGNSSFSRDHFFALYKSGELPRLDQDPLSITSKLQTVMETENGGRDSPVTEFGTMNDCRKEISFFSSSEDEKRLTQLPGRATRQPSVSSSSSSENHDRKSESSAVSFHYLLTDADKGPPAKMNKDKRYPQTSTTMVEPKPESHMKTQNTARQRLLFWLSCRSSTCCSYAD